MKTLRSKNDKLVPIMFFGFALIFGIISVVIFIHSKGLQRRCTEEVQAEIVSIDKKIDIDEDGSSTTYFYNVYAYDYKDKHYIEKSSTNKQDHLGIGTTVTIKINPNKPTEFIDSTSGGVLTVLWAVFGGFSAVFFVISLIVLKAMKKGAL